MYFNARKKQAEVLFNYFSSDAYNISIAYRVSKILKK